MGLHTVDMAVDNRYRDAESELTRPVSRGSELGRYEPSFSNPEMLLPNATIDAMELPQTGRPPSPSYLVLKKKKTRSNLAAAYASSPSQDTPQSQQSRRHSYGASSINSEELDAMRIPEFANLDSDTETMYSEDDFDIGTPVYGMDLAKRNDGEQSSATLMRAELILANAKKRLNMMDQNLRGAREMVAPLTAANLKRATSLSVEHHNRRPYAYAPYESQQPNFSHMRVFSNPENGPEIPERSYSALGRLSLSLNRREQGQGQGPPVNKQSPSWTSNTLRASRSLERSRVPSVTPELAEDEQPSQQNITSSDIRSSSCSSSTTNQNTMSTSSSAQNLREQMTQLRNRMSTLKERATEDNLRRRSMLSLRDNNKCLLNDAQPQEKRPNLVRITRESSVPGAWISARTIPDEEEEDAEFDDNDINYLPYPQYTESAQQATTVTPQHQPEFTQRATATSQYQPSEDNDTIYQDAPASPPERHEDREDAFDYSKFFLHSATGSFSRPRQGSISSDEGSVSTARAEGPDTFKSVPPTPETPEVLRNIELQRMHNRTKSSESVTTTQTFETAQEAVKTPPSIAEWLKRSTEARTDSGLGDRQRTRPTSRQQLQTYVSIPPSPAAIAVSALTGDEPLGLKDKALLFTLVESLKAVCEKLQTTGESEYESRLLRRRLDDARRALDGDTRVDP